MNRSLRRSVLDFGSSRVRRQTNRKRSKNLRPIIEGLEDRIVLSMITWGTANAPNGGDWNSTASWVGGVVPTSSDTAVIKGLTGSGIVTISSTASDSVLGLTTDSSATLKVSGSLSLGAGSSSTLGGPVNIASGASLSVGGGASVRVSAGQTLTDSGMVSFATGDTVTMSGSGGASQLVVGGTLTASGTT